ncbi:hypothetical protein N7524_010884 [Penicillium chrysogenum]|nr:hypothetical protein N7524_010884 [Penicillium chrysogenum]
MFLNTAKIVDVVSDVPNTLNGKGSDWQEPPLPPDEHPGTTYQLPIPWKLNGLQELLWRIVADRGAGQIASGAPIRPQEHRLCLQDHQSIPGNTDSVFRITRSPDHPSVPRNTRPSLGSPVHPQEHPSIPRNTSPSPGSPVRPQDHPSIPRITDSVFRNTRPSPGTPVHPQDHQNDS